MASSLKTLITKLNPACRRAAERAASLCMSHGHHEVDVEHLMLALLEQPDGDLTLLLRHQEVSAQSLRQDLQRELQALRAGNTRTPVFSARWQVLLEHAWLIASLDRSDARIRAAHLVLALLTEPSLAQMAHRASPCWSRLRLDDLRHRLDEVTRGSAEAGAAERPADGAELADRAPAAGAGALEQYTLSLTRKAREGGLDPVIGRDAEIRQTIDILMRQRQNNPILTGEAGVGKTAIVEGLALRLVSDDVPPALKGVELHVLDLGLLQAGASVKGEFEQRLRQVIDEVRQSPHPIVLFIDEAHTMIGAGGPAGQGDAANLLKPALARGELRTIAATTWGEYKKYFEKDAALARRFQVVKVEEPDEATAAAMLRAMVPLMERHFGVRIYDEAVTEAVRLSARYINGRQLPDKCVSVLDTACAKVALAQSATPAPIEDLQHRLAQLDAEVQALSREVAAGRDHAPALEALQAEHQRLTHSLAALHQRHQRELAIVQDIQRCRARLEADRSEPTEAGAEARSELAAKLEVLAALQGEQSLVPMQVDGHVVAEVVAAWTGIPLGKMVKDEIRTVLGLKGLLQARVLGQDHALDAIAQRIQTSRAQLEDPCKPKGVFLFVGPSGVGKTETALALADVLYGGERKLITINMSEYQEAHSVSGLKGSPPGYVGYGEGGVLTEAVRRNPYCVVLLDEVEKAHPDVLELFYQVFDKGVLDDAEGRSIDFRHCLIILTSNVGSGAIMKACLNRPLAERPTVEAVMAAVRPALYQTFKPAFLGRTTVVPYLALPDEVMTDIIRLKLSHIGERVREHHGARFEHDTRLVEALLARCHEADSGARNVDHLLGSTLLPGLAQQVLARMASGEPVRRVKVGARANGDFRYQLT